MSSSRRRTRADIQYCSPSGRVDLNFLGGLFSKEDIGSYARSVREEKGKPHHDFGNRRSHSSQTVTA